MWFGGPLGESLRERLRDLQSFEEDIIYVFYMRDKSKLPDCNDYNVSNEDIFIKYNLCDANM